MYMCVCIDVKLQQQQHYIFSKAYFHLRSQATTKVSLLTAINLNIPPSAARHAVSVCLLFSFCAASVIYFFTKQQFNFGFLQFAIHSYPPYWLVERGCYIHTFIIQFSSSSLHSAQHFCNQSHYCLFRFFRKLSVQTQCIEVILMRSIIFEYS